MDPLPLVTVIITTYNYAHTVGVAIDSALAQDYPNLEVLVVDNCSTDSTPQLVERYQGDPRFRYIRNESNIGMVPNHNKGLRESRGEYVLFLSADDFLLPGHIVRSFRFLRDNPEIDVLYASAVFVDEGGRLIGQRSMTGQPFGAYTGGRHELAGLLTEGCYMCFPTMLMRRDLYERFGELDEEIKAADYEIVLRWAANGIRFAYLPEPNCGVRIHSSQQSSPQNYIADAGDIREFLYLVKKFAEPFGPQLRGYEQTISRHMWSRLDWARQAGVADAGGELRAALLDVDGILSAVRMRNEAAKPAPHVTVIVLPPAHVGVLERTMHSLVAQTYGDWDAIVLQDAGQSMAPLGPYLDPRGRVRGLRLIGAVGEAAAINTGLRVAAGDCFIVLRAGTELPPQHFEAVLAGLASGQALAARTQSVVVIHRPDPAGGLPFERHEQLFMPPSESRLSFTAPFGPIESLAFTRAAIDRVGPFNEQLPAFTAWEFLLRVQLQSSVAAVSSPVFVHIAAGSAEAYAQCAVLPAIARAVHAAFTSAEASVRIEREAYLRNLQSMLDRGPEAAANAAGIVQLLEVANGMDLIAGIR